MAKPGFTLQDAIVEASGEGFKVWYDESPESRGWWITTPHRPRRPPEDHGAFASEIRAWMAAASMARDLRSACGEDATRKDTDRA